LWQPTLFDRQRADRWRASGSKRLSDRLREKTVALIDSHKPQPLPEAVKQETDYILGQQ
jgi:trimethylamine:corrinoid methyltransferase-like protein